MGETLPRCALLWRYGPDSPGYAGLAAAARAMGITLRPVRDGDLAARVGDLCAGRPGPPFAPLILLPPTPSLIVSGLSPADGSLGTFLDLARAAGAVFPLRAMVTPTSAGWTLLRLLQELEQERKAVEHGQ